MKDAASSSETSLNFYKSARRHIPDSNPGGGEIFRTCPDQPWGPPSLLYNGYRIFPGGKERAGRDADLSPLLVPWSRKGRAIPLLPYAPYGLYRASVPVQGDLYLFYIFVY